MSNLISCPSCRTEIEITEALEAQLTAQIRREMGAELKAKQAELSLAHSKLADQRQSFCLLYTSPSPRDRQKSRMPSSA